MDPLIKKSSAEIFPWKSEDLLRIKNSIQKGWDWKHVLFGADSFERELFIGAVAEEVPALRFDCAELKGKDLQKEIFGTYHFTKTEEKVRNPGLEQQIGNGILLLENIDLMPRDTQIVLASVIDSKIGWRIGPHDYEEIPVRFKLIAAFDGNLPADFHRHLFYRLGFSQGIKPLSQRPEDLLPVLKYAMEKLKYARSDLLIADSFWEMLESRVWPFSLGQWVSGITDFFQQNTNCEMSWNGFISALDFDFDDVIHRYDRLKRKHAMQARGFLLDHINRASDREALQKSLGFLSWHKLVEEVINLGLNKDTNICQKLLVLPHCSEE